MEKYVSWIQLSVTALLFALVIGTFKSMLNTAKEHFNREMKLMGDKIVTNDKALKESNHENKTEFIRRDWIRLHDTICENRELKLKEYITKSLDAVFKELRELGNKIDSLDGRTYFLKDKPPNGLDLK